MSVLRMVVGDMLACQQRYQSLIDSERTWRPEDGWGAGAVILVQWRQGLAAQVRAMRACSAVLAAHYAAAANDETPPEAA